MPEQSVINMQTTTYQFSSAATTVYTDAPLHQLGEWVTGKIIIITDEQVYAAHRDKMMARPCIVLQPGEAHKTQATADYVIAQLIAQQADRATTLVGVGGGVITDLTGYVASIYMRGIPFGFVPTSILAMVDAAIGGKNGVDVGMYKNLVGTIRQPQFLWYDVALLQSLPDVQWINGFAEIIKHACIKDAALFDLLERHTLTDFKQDAELLAALIRRNIDLKCSIVAQDEWEKGDRKLLNFGHTIGHAIENAQGLLHGFAVSLGMVAACRIAEEINNFHSAEKERVIALLQRYGLPVELRIDKAAVAHMVMMDKKRTAHRISFILPATIGHAEIVPISTEQFQDLLEQIF
jgi:3-dehydroquinate synthase